VQTDARSKMVIFVSVGWDETNGHKQSLSTSDMRRPVGDVIRCQAKVSTDQPSTHVARDS
jgi:hypothetical protein